MDILCARVSVVRVYFILYWDWSLPSYNWLHRDFWPSTNIHHGLIQDCFQLPRSVPSVACSSCPEDSPGLEFQLCSQVTKVGWDLSIGCNEFEAMASSGSQFIMMHEYPQILPREAPGSSFTFPSTHTQFFLAVSATWLLIFLIPIPSTGIEQIKDFRTYKLHSPLLLFYFPIFLPSSVVIKF